MQQVTLLTAVRDAEETRLVASISAGGAGLTVSARCADLAELLAAGHAGKGRCALVSADLAMLDRDAVALLNGCGVAVVGVPRDRHAQGDRERLQGWGIEQLAPSDASAPDIERVVRQAVHAVAPTMPALQRSDPPPQSTSRQEPGTPLGAAGRVVAVWGPVGAPGRTTIAVNLAAAFAEAGQETLLVDVDTYGSSTSQVLGVLDDAPGVAAACRSASGGSLNPAVLARIAVSTQERLRVLTGVASADRWPELSPAGLEQVWRTARDLCPWTVVDTGPVLEEDEELSYDTRAPRRNAATLSALRAADQVIVVGRADPVGLARLLRALVELGDTVPGCAPVVIVTAVRAAACGTDAAGEIRRLLGRHAGVDPVIITDDRAALDAALLRGGLPAKKSLTRAAMSQLAARLSSS